jgi:hypothetical protein
MADDPASESTPEATGTATTCPWCSTALPAADTPVCPSCGAHLVEEEEVEIPGVTSVSPDLRASAATPRRVRRTFGSLLVGDDDEIPLPSEAEMPALAPPDPDVRREMLRLEMEARLAALHGEVNALRADEIVPPGPPTGAGEAAAGPAEPPADAPSASPDTPPTPPEAP